MLAANIVIFYENKAQNVENVMRRQKKDPVFNRVPSDIASV